MPAPFSTDPGRLEAFSDGVLAVIITIMVLELKPLAQVLFVIVALMWFIPDRRMERVIAKRPAADES